MDILIKISNLFEREFPTRIKGVYIYYEFCYKEKSPYCVNLWKNIDWQVGGIVPMFEKDNKIAFYKITNRYYVGGDSMSDWAIGDDGRERDFKFHHKQKLTK